MSITRNPIPFPGRRVVGIDPSLTATGVAFFEGGVCRSVGVLRSSPDPAVPYPERLWRQVRALRKTVLSYTPVLIAMEAEIFTANRVQSSQASGIQAAYQMMLYQHVHSSTAEDESSLRGARFLSVNVSHVKKWLGAQKKDEILLAVYKRYHTEFKDHNEADAFTIGVIGDAFLARSRGLDLGWTQPQKEVLAKLMESGLVWEPRAPRAPKKKQTKAV